MNPFVHSNFDRRLNDHYPTIDPRCVNGLLEHIKPSGRIVDCCAPNGSDITKELDRLGYDAHNHGDAMADFITADWIITNPPYDRGIVEKIVHRQINRLADKEIIGFCSLHRTGFDHAKNRYKSGMFLTPFYNGQIKLCFRPWWSKDQTKQPIHMFVWHIWTVETMNPVVLYASGQYPESKLLVNNQT